MDELISVYCKNNNTTKCYKPGVSAWDIYQDMNLNFKYQVVGARVNNKTESLSFKIYKPKDIEFIDITDSSGRRIYVRSLCFIMYKAVDELFPGGHLRLEHPVSKGYYCNLCIGHPITDKDVSDIKIKMQEIIDRKLPIEYVQERTTEVVEHFRDANAMDKVLLLPMTGKLYTGYYRIENHIDYYYGALLPSTDFLYLFDVMRLDDGLLLRIPNSRHPQLLEDAVSQPKMLEVFAEFLRWNKIMDLENVGNLNKHCLQGHATDLIKVSEAFHEKKIALIADHIFEKRQSDNGAKFILISGPSSSGKTTFSKRLSIQLMTNGLIPVALSLDDYFVERVNTPKDESGDYDYESLYALDLELFNKQLQQLLNGEEVELPTYSFETGTRCYKGNKLKINDNTVLVIEGIHALNPALTPIIPDEMKYKIYVSALTTISLDDHNWIPTTDNRLLRRILRDYRYRNYSAQETIQRWPKVRLGEDKWIFPYQENADEMFNSALLFELAVIKKYVEPILTEVPQNCVEYAEAKRLLHFLSYFTPIHDWEIPPTSLLREFFGGSSFHY